MSQRAFLYRGFRPDGRSRVLRGESRTAAGGVVSHWKRITAAVFDPDPSHRVGRLVVPEILPDPIRRDSKGARPPP